MWLVVLIGGFLFFIPEAQKHYDEFGIELTMGVLLLLNISDRAVIFWPLFVPMLVLTVVVAETVQLAIPPGRMRRVIGFIDWALIIGIALLLVILLAWPLLIAETADFGAIRSGNLVKCAVSPDLTDFIVRAVREGLPDSAVREGLPDFR